MRKLKKISLQSLAQNEMATREKNLIKGGRCACVSVCGCLYAGSQQGSGDSYYGGSSTGDNDSANSTASVNRNTN